MNRELRASLRAAVRSALAGDWEAAHVVVQAHEEEPLANWIHAVVHRMEGDAGNAAYWFRRSGRAFRRDVAIEDELREIEREIGSTDSSPA